MKLLISLLFCASLAYSATVHNSITQDGTIKAGEKTVCYFTNWARYRPGGSQYVPDNIDPSICTNILYSFATLNSQSLTIQVADPQTDIVDGFYAQVTALKSRGVKVSIAIGGWSDSQGNKYSRMVNSASARANFVQSAVDFLRQYNFDGLDLDWEYPVCWQGDCNAGPASDKQNFANLVTELRNAFRPYGFLLSAAVSASSSVASRAYDIPTLSAQLDWIGLMTYDMAGGWDGRTGYQSALGGSGSNTMATVNYWVQNGAARNKLAIGVPLYGRSFTLQNQNNNGVGAPASNGAPGEYTNEAGYIGYFEFCTGGWTRVYTSGVGPYVYRGNQWISYDDTQIIQEKAQYVKSNGLAGAIVWAIDLDDWNGNYCGAGRYPLLRTLHNSLQS